MPEDRPTYPTPWGPTEAPPSFRARGAPDDLAMAPETRPVPMCGTCHVVLASITRSGERLWFHPPTAPSSDHEARPVRQTQQAWKSACDACGEASAGGARFWVSESEDPEAVKDQPRGSCV